MDAQAADQAPPEDPLTDSSSEDSALSLAPADQSESPMADVGPEPASAQTPGSSGESAKKADMIVVWRPDRRRPPFHRAERQDRQAGSGAPPPDLEGRGRPSTSKRSPKAAMRPSTSPNRPNPPRHDEKRRQRTSEYDMPRVHSTTAPQHKAKVDPDSPFAKLLELRSLLEGQANKRP